MFVFVTNEVVVSVIQPVLINFPTFNTRNVMEIDRRNLILASLVSTNCILIIVFQVPLNVLGFGKVEGYREGVFSTNPI